MFFENASQHTELAHSQEYYNVSYIIISSTFSWRCFSLARTLLPLVFARAFSLEPILQRNIHWMRSVCVYLLRCENCEKYLKWFQQEEKKKRREEIQKWWDTNDGELTATASIKLLCCLDAKRKDNVSVIAWCFLRFLSFLFVFNERYSSYKNMSGTRCWWRKKMMDVKEKRQIEKRKTWNDSRKRPKKNEKLNQRLTEDVQNNAKRKGKNTKMNWIETRKILYKREYTRFACALNHFIKYTQQIHTMNTTERVPKERKKINRMP